MERPKNFAPEGMEGFYTLYVKDNQIFMTKDQKKVSCVIYPKDMLVTVKCSPEDKFDFAEGIKLAMERFQENNIHIGDIVEIVDPGSGCASLSPLSFKNVPIEYMVRYRYGVVPEAHAVGKVVHLLNSDRNNKFALVQIDSCNYEGNNSYKSLTCPKPIYCVGLKGLKKVE